LSTRQLAEAFNRITAAICIIVQLLDLNVYSRYIPNLTRKDGSAFEKFLDEKIPVKENKEADE